MATHTGLKVKTGVALGLAAAAAAGYYFYGSDKAKQHRKIATRWAADMKDDVMSKAAQLKEMSAKDFATIVDTVSATYAGARAIDASDLKRAAQELKDNWKEVQKELVTKASKAAAKARKAG
ncbi:MAG: hypothetical protein AAB442_01910 [Patescibacteria group bacterium]